MSGAHLTSQLAHDYNEQCNAYFTSFNQKWRTKEVVNTSIARLRSNQQQPVAALYGQQVTENLTFKTCGTLKCHLWAVDLELESHIAYAKVWHSFAMSWRPRSHSEEQTQNNRYTTYQTISSHLEAHNERHLLVVVVIIIKILRNAITK